jgi:hypothetical protein
MSNNLGRFRSGKEKEYFLRRKKILKSVSSNFVADNPFLFSTRQEVSDSIARFKLFDQILDISGYIVECGSNNGNHLVLFSLLSSVLEPYALNRKIISFDTFDGFRSISKFDGKISTKQFSKKNLKLLKEVISINNLNRSQGHINKIELVVGDAVKTIPKWVKKNNQCTIALLYIDFDIYKPTYVALKNLVNLVSKGGIIVFDQINYDKFAGETKAIKEFFNLKKTKFKRFNFHPFIGYTVV